MTAEGTYVTRAYDGENRLVYVNDHAYVTQFAYGPDGARLKKVASAVTTLYFGDDVEVLPFPWGAPTYTKYLPGDAKRVGLGGSATTTWLHRDHLRSVRAITNAAGGIVDRANYRPFGEQLGFATATESKGYIGEREDESGLLYLHARYYDPVLARFIQADPLNPALPGVGVNRYAYAFNNPIMFLDPFGLKGGDNDRNGGSAYGNSGTSNSGGQGGCVCGGNGGPEPANNPIGGLVNGQPTFNGDVPAQLIADLYNAGAFNQTYSNLAKPIAEAVAKLDSFIGGLKAAQLPVPGIQVASLTLTQLVGSNFYEFIDQTLNNLAAQLNIPRDQLVMILGPNLPTVYFPRSANYGLRVYNFGDELEDLDFDEVQVINATLLTTLDLYRPGLEDQSAPVVIGQETYISAGLGYYGNGAWQRSWPDERTFEIRAARAGRFVRGGGFIPAESP